MNGYHIEGLITNADFADAVLNHPAFIAGDLTTDFIGSHFEKGQMKQSPPFEMLYYMAMAATLVYRNRQNLVRNSLKPMAAHVGGIRSGKAVHHYRVKGENDILELRVQGDQISRTWIIGVNENPYQVITPEFEFYRRRIKLKIDGRTHLFRIQYHGNFI